jgi:hypothetical protein
LQTGGVWLQNDIENNINLVPKLLGLPQPFPNADPGDSFLSLIANSPAAPIISSILSPLAILSPLPPGVAGGAGVSGGADGSNPVGGSGTSAAAAVPTEAEYTIFAGCLVVAAYMVLHKR